MALGYDGSIRIDTKINGDGFSKGLAKMSADMEKQVKKSETLLDGLQKKREQAQKALLDAQKNLGTIVDKQNPLVEQLDAAKRKLEQFRALSDKYRDYANKQTSPAAFEKYQEAEAEVKRLESEIEKITSEILKQEKAIDRANDEIYKQQQAVKGYDAEIERATQALEQQRMESGKISEQFGKEKQDLEEIGNAAQVGNRHIVDLSHKLAELQERQKILESAGLGLGYKEYDENARKIASITAELKRYQSELQNIKIAQSGLSGFLATLDEIKSSFASIYDAAKPGLEKIKDGFGKFWEEFAKTSEQNFARIAQRFTSSDFFQVSQENFAKIGQRLSSVFEPIMDKLANSERFQELKSTFASVFGSIGDFAKESAQNVGPTISSMAQSFASAFGRMGSYASEFAGKLNVVIAAVKTVYEAIKSIVSAIVDRFKEIVSSISSVVTPVVKKMAELTTGALSTIKDGIAALGKGIAEATKSIVKFAAENNVLTKVTDAVGKKLERLGGMIRRVFVFSVITRGLRALRSELASYLQLNDQFSASLRTLQGVLLTAFQPIYDAVLPALTTLINFLSSAIAVVSQFIATLFGTTVKKAQKNAEALYKQAHAVEAVGGAAKQAAKDAETAVAAFDEFNILSFPDQSGGGGGGGGAGGIEMPDFDYEYEDMPFDSWGEAFSAFLDKLLAGLPKLEEAFKKFADWLNDLAKKLYDMFTFPGVLDKVKALGKGLAEALNKLVNWIDWNMLGKALGAGLNLALNFLTSFLYAFDWMNLGRKLAEFVNGLVSEIDWYEFGRLLWAGFKIALETLAGFLLGLDMPLMARAASNVIKGFFDEMYNTIERIPWGDIGKQLATFLNNIDWYGSITVALKAISAAFEALFEMLDGFVRNLHWDDIAKQIYTAINDSLGLIDWHNIGQTLGNAFVQAFEFARKIISGIDWHLIGSNIADFILGFDFVSALSGLGQLIASGINAAIELACGFLDKVSPELKSIAEGIAEGLRQAITAVDWKALGDVIGRGIKGALTFVSGLLDPDLFYAIGRAIGDFLVGLDWVGIIGGLTEVLANAIKSAVAAMTGFMDSVEPHLEEIATGIAEKINQFLRDVDWEELGRTISRGIELALDFLIDVIEQIDWTEVGSAIGDLLSGIDWSGIFERVCRIIADVFGAKLLAKIIALPDLLKAGIAIVEGLIKGIWEGIKGIGTIIYNSLFKPIVDAITSLWEIHSPSKVTERIGKNIVEGLILGIKETWNGIIEFLKTGVDAIKNFFSGAWEDVKGKTSEAWTAIKETVSGIWDSIKETAGTIFDGIKEKISAAWDGLKEKTSAIWENIKTTLSTAWDNLKTAASEKFENIKTAISTAWENVKTKTTEIWNNIKTTLSTLWNELKTTVTTVFTEIKNKVVEVWTTIKNEAVAKWSEIKSTISEKINNIKQTVTEGFTRVKETITGKVTEAINALKSNDWASVGRGIVDGIFNGLNGIFDKLRSWASRVWESVSSAFNGGGRSSGGSSGRRSSSRAVSYSSYRMAAEPAYASVQLPKLANGAVIPPNQQFMAILGDQRSGINVETPLSTIKQAVSETLREMGGMGGDIHITVESVLDGKVIARNTVTHINDFTRAAGKPVLLF